MREALQIHRLEIISLYTFTILTQYFLFDYLHIVSKQQPVQIILSNAKARHEFELSEPMTAGILLVGSEARSIRENDVSITEAYCYINEGEIFVRGMRINPYKFAVSDHRHDPDRDKKLLLKKREIERLAAKLRGTNLTIVPIELLAAGGKFKLKIALARGKKKWDKRQAEKSKDAEKEIKTIIP